MHQRYLILKPKHINLSCVCSVNRVTICLNSIGDLQLINCLKKIYCWRGWESFWIYLFVFKGYHFNNVYPMSFFMLRNKSLFDIFNHVHILIAVWLLIMIHILELQFGKSSLRTINSFDKILFLSDCFEKPILVYIEYIYAVSIGMLTYCY